MQKISNSFLLPRKIVELYISTSSVYREKKDFIYLFIWNQTKYKFYFGVLRKQKKTAMDAQQQQRQQGVPQRPRPGAGGGGGGGDFTPILTVLVAFIAIFALVNPLLSLNYQYSAYKLYIDSCVYEFVHVLFSVCNY